MITAERSGIDPGALPARLRDVPEVWEGSHDWWLAFVTLDTQRGFTFNPRGQEVPLPLAVKDTLAYGAALGLCYTLEDTSDYLAVMGALDEVLLTHRRHQIRAAAESSKT